MNLIFCILLSFQITGPVAKYNPPCPFFLRMYLFGQFISLAIGFLKFNQLRLLGLSYMELAIYSALFIMSFQSFGYFFDCKQVFFCFHAILCTFRRIAVPFECIRLLCLLVYGFYTSKMEFVLFTTASFVFLFAVISKGHILVRHEDEKGAFSYVSAFGNYSDRKSN